MRSPSNTEDRNVSPSPASPEKTTEPPLALPSWWRNTPFEASVRCLNPSLAYKRRHVSLIALWGWIICSLQQSILWIKAFLIIVWICFPLKAKEKRLRKIGPGDQRSLLRNQVNKTTLVTPFWDKVWRREEFHADGRSVLISCSEAIS